MYHTIVSLLYKYKAIVAGTIVLMVLLGLVLSISVGLYALYKIDNKALRLEQTKKSTDVDKPVLKRDVSLVVEVSGAVLHPGAYMLEEGDRLNDALRAAGGLSRSADTDFFGRNYNLARVLRDQDKIYVPRKDEIASGVFEEGRYIIDADVKRIVSAKPVANESEDSNIDQSININTSAKFELEQLEGIGPVTAQKIIDNRPYTDLLDLRARNILGEKVYAAIQARLSL